MKHKTTLIILLLTALIVSACGSAAQPTAAPTSPPESEIAATDDPAQEATEAQGATEALELTDALDRQVAFDEPPQRIVVAGRATPLLADAVYLFPEAEERVVAIEARFQMRDDPFYPIIDPTYDQVSLLEMNASAEQILPENPDVVVMKTFMAESLGEPLAEVGVPVVYLELETPEQYVRDINTLGQLFGNPARADEINEFYTNRQQRVLELVEESGSEQTPSVLLAQYSEQDGEVSVEVPSASWLQTSLVEMAGGEPVWVEAAPSGGWTVVGFEQIAAWDPDKIFIVNYGEDSSQTVDRLAEDPNWASLTAVQNQEIYGFPSDFLSWDQPDTRWILGLQWLATKINPELTEQIDIMAEVEAFFGQLYGMEAAAIESEIMTRLEGDLP